VFYQSNVTYQILSERRPRIQKRRIVKSKGREKEKKNKKVIRKQ
jgi:hypothetical protein